uniref:Uncharacterized protein n=1 Tax=Heterorhabditis bacteriophora TaxID=37862 RepID=A0A1I7XQ53_HETBA
MEPIVVDDEHSNNQRQTTVGNDSERMRLRYTILVNRTVGDVLREALGSRYRRTPRTEVKKEQPSSLVSFRSPSPPPVDVKLFNSEEISRQTREQSFIPHSGSAPTRRGWVKSRSNAHFDRFLSGIVASLGEEAFMETAGSERISSPQEEIETINNKPMSVHGTTPIRRGRGRPRKHPLPGNT